MTIRPRLPLFPNHPVAALAVICLSVFVISVDATIVNVALPTMSRELDADTAQLQWIVDAYTLAAQANSADTLIAGRAAMGVGAAVIFPSTLALITNIFTNAAGRARAIGVWAAMVGVGVAAGPITGGWLLE
ncbi:MAG TPA: MFS transporter, partial [Mycobacterium sp.]|nr:MFS transporter [Mycobacterium sp.]